MSVVSMTTATMTEKTSSDTTPSVLPVTAKIRPTSPRGTIPQPTIHLLTEPAAMPAMILPATAAVVMPSAVMSMAGVKNTSSLTCMPV